MRSELCNRCGSCVGLSGGAIRFADREGKFRPVVRDGRPGRVDPGKESTQENGSASTLDRATWDRLLDACPGKDFSFPRYREYFYPSAPRFHPFTGAYEQMYIGHARDPQLRSTGASGGILSTVLVYLLEKGRIDGAVITRMSGEKPWLTEPFIATTREEILQGAQSKYILSSVNEILPQIGAFKGKLAYVGLPGQVQGIRKLQKAGDPLVKNIRYILGPYYGNTLHFSSVKSFLRSHGEKDYRRIRELHFRHGEWPGNMRVVMESGRVIELKKFHANYLIPFHIVRNSLYCTDFSNEFTDISGGDAWAPVYEERGKGFSTVVGRSPEGKALLEEMQREGWLELNPLDEQESIEMHSHGYDFKKRGAFIRIRLRKLCGKAVPDWGYTQGPFPLKRWAMELLISTLFILLGTRLASWTVERFSPAFIGRIFELTRTRWKKSTHNIKRESLT